MRRTTDDKTLEGFYPGITQKLPSVLILIFAVSSAPVRRNFDSL